MTDIKPNEPKTTEELKKEIIKQGKTAGRRKLLVVLIPVIFLILVGIGVGTYLVEKKTNQNNSTVLAQVGSEKITQADLNKEIYSTNFIGTPASPADVTKTVKSSLLDGLIEKKIIANEAKQLGITASDQEINTDIQSKDITLADYSPQNQAILKEESQARILSSKVKDAILGWKAGQYLFFRFDKYLNEGGSVSVAGEGDATLIEQQKAYAQTLANKTYTELTSKSINFEQAFTNLTQDPQISAAAFSPLRPNIYGQFDQDAYLNNDGYFNDNNYPGFKNNVSAIGVNQDSQPFLVKALINGKVQDIAYAIVQVDQSGQGTWSSYSQWLNNQYTVLNVKKYSQNIAYKLSTPGLVNVAYAEAEGPNCLDTSTHNTNIKLEIDYLDASGNAQPFNGITSTLVAPYLNEFSKVNKNGTCDTSSYKTIGSEPTVSRVSGAHGYPDGIISYANIYGQDGKAFTVDCDNTAVAQIDLTNSGVATGLIPGTHWGGEWTLTGHNDWIDQTYNKGTIRPDLGELRYALATPGNTNWANGSVVVTHILFANIDWGHKLTIVNNNPNLGEVVQPATATNIACGGSSSDCIQQYRSGTNVTLTALPANGNTVTWSGCTVGNNNTCSVVMDKDRTVMVSFGTNSTPACGLANGVPTSIAPSSNLCNAPSTPSTVTGTGPWFWTCSLGAATPIPCNAPVAPSKPGLTCTFSPSQGNSPLLTKIQVLPIHTGAPYTYTITKDGKSFIGITTFASNETDLTLSLPGSYYAYVSNAQVTTPVQCLANIMVKNPTAPNGGEVAP